MTYFGTSLAVIAEQQLLVELMNGSSSHLLLHLSEYPWQMYEYSYLYIRYLYLGPRTSLLLHVRVRSYFQHEAILVTVTLKKLPPPSPPNT
jgi:hypothetical protein